MHNRKKVSEGYIIQKLEDISAMVCHSTAVTTYNLQHSMKRLETAVSEIFSGRSGTTGDDVKGTFGNKGERRQQVLMRQSCVLSLLPLSTVIVAGLLLTIPGGKLQALADAWAV